MKADLDLLNQLLTRAEREKDFRSYRAPLRSAQAFRLDDATTELVAEMTSVDRPMAMIDMYRQLARLPFDKVWIEYDYHTLHRWRAAHGHLAEDAAPDHSTPTRSGFLCERLRSHEEAMKITTVGLLSPRQGDPREPYVFVVCHNLTTGRDKVMFAGNKADRPAVNEMIEKMNRSMLPALGWGIGFGPDDLDKWMQHPLFCVNGVEPEGPSEDSAFDGRSEADAIDLLTRVMVMSAKEQRGDLRFIVGALALINHVPCVYKPHRPKGRMLASSTTKPFMESRVVSIDVPHSKRRIKVVDKLLRNSLALQHRKRHRVRGHWRVSIKSHGDRWQPFTDPFSMQRRWRIWIETHERGDASLGWVEHSYGVHGRPGARAAVGLTP